MRGAASRSEQARRRGGGVEGGGGVGRGRRRRGVRRRRRGGRRQAGVVGVGGGVVAWVGRNRGIVRRRGSSVRGGRRGRRRRRSRGGGGGVAAPAAVASWARAAAWTARRRRGRDRRRRGRRGRRCRSAGVRRCRGRARLGGWRRPLRAVARAASPRPGPAAGAARARRRRAARRTRSGSGRRGRRSSRSPRPSIGHGVTICAGRSDGSSEASSLARSRAAMFVCETRSPSTERISIESRRRRGRRCSVPIRRSWSLRERRRAPTTSRTSAPPRTSAACASGESVQVRVVEQRLHGVESARCAAPRRPRPPSPAELLDPAPAPCSAGVAHRLQLGLVSAWCTTRCASPWRCVVVKVCRRCSTRACRPRTPRP